MKKILKILVDQKLINNEEKIFELYKLIEKKNNTDIKIEIIIPKKIEFSKNINKFLNDKNLLQNILIYNLMILVNSLESKNISFKTNNL